MNPGALLLSWLVLAPTAAEPATPPAALEIHAGAIAHDQVVALGRDLVIDGEALADTAAINGSVWLSGLVRGNVIVLGGDAHLASGARVEGDVYVLGGVIDAEPGVHVDGRAVAYPTAAHAWLSMLEAPGLGLQASSPVLLATKLGLLTVWVLLVLLLFATSRKAVLSTSEAVRREPFRNFFVGLVGVITFFLTALFLSAFTGPLVGIPMLTLVVIWLLVLKLWGMVAVFHALGEWCCRRFHRRPAALQVATLGLLLLGACKFVPAFGLWLWTLATLIGVGATLTTKFGRREPWFDLRALEQPAPLLP